MPHHLGLLCWALLTLPLFSQADSLAIEVELTNGERHLLVGPGELRLGTTALRIREWGSGRFRLTIHNEGRPRWILGARTDGDDFFFRRLTAAIPRGFVIKDWLGKECTPDPGGSEALASRGAELWHLVLPEQSKDPHQAVPGSTQFHYLEGGTSAYWDVRTEADLLAPLPSDPEVVTLCRTWRGLGEFREDLLPRLVRLRSLMTASPGSAVFRSPVRDLGWLALHWSTRFSGDRKPKALGWFVFGSLVGADGHSNHNYDPEEACIEQWLRSGDRGAYELASTLALAKIHHGLYRTVTDSPAAYRWAYEKSSYPGKPGDYRFPEPSHEWDAGTLMVAHLSGDPDLLDAMRHRGEAVLRTKVPALRAFGARKVGWLLRNLRAHYHFTRDVRFLDRARELSQMVFDTAKPGETWLSNDVLGPNAQVDPWQEALFYSEVLAFQDQGLRGSFSDRVPEFVRWTIDHGTRIVPSSLGPALEGGYTYNRETKSLTAPWPSTAIWFLPLLARLASENAADRDRYYACLTSSFGMAFQGWTNAAPLLPAREAQLDCSGYGAHGRKTMSQLLIFAEDRWLPR